MSSLREALSAAFDAEETSAVDTAPVETPDEPRVETPSETPAETAARERDERGRFAARQAEQPQVAEPVVERKPPSSWKKDHWGAWQKFDPAVQDYIEQRENEAARGVSTYKQQADQAAPVLRAIEPYMQDLQRAGVTPDQWIGNLGHVHRTLSQGSPEQKTQLLMQMAQANGVDLRAAFGGQADPQFGHMTQTVAALQNRIQQWETQAQRQEQARLQSTITEFAATAPHFEAVKATMGQLLGSGVASDLKTAYDKAIRLHDDVWQQEQASQAKAQAAARQKEIDAKRAAASSPRSSSPTGALTQANGKKGLRELLSDSFDMHTTGRI